MQDDASKPEEIEQRLDRELETIEEKADRVDAEKSYKSRPFVRRGVYTGRGEGGDVGTDAD
jgi:hypothetical protein